MGARRSWDLSRTSLGDDDEEASDPHEEPDGPACAEEHSRWERPTVAVAEQLASIRHQTVEEEGVSGRDEYTARGVDQAADGRRWLMISCGRSPTTAEEGRAAHPSRRERARGQELGEPESGDQADEGCLGEEGCRERRVRQPPIADEPRGWVQACAHHRNQHKSAPRLVGSPTEVPTEVPSMYLSICLYPAVRDSQASLARARARGEMDAFSPAFRSAPACARAAADADLATLGLPTILPIAEAARFATRGAGALLGALNGTLRVDVSPSRDAPAKLFHNDTLIRPAETQLPQQEVVHLLRQVRVSFLTEFVLTEFVSTNSCVQKSTRRVLRAHLMSLPCVKSAFPPPIAEAPSFPPPPPPLLSFFDPPLLFRQTGIFSLSDFFSCVAGGIERFLRLRALPLTGGAPAASGSSPSGWRPLTRRPTPPGRQPLARRRCDALVTPL